MKAIFFEGPHQHVIKDIPEPKLGPTDVLLKPGFCGVCVMDKYRHEGLPDPTQHQRNVGKEAGHEFGAVVAAVGTEVQSLRPGQRVVVYPFVHDDECPMCRAGFYTKCLNPPGSTGTQAAGGRVRYGGFSEYCTFPENCCYPIPDTVTQLQAASVEGVACGTRAVRLSGMSVGDNVVFLGAEDWNMGAFQWAKASGGNRILCADPIPARREMLTKLGATAVLDPTVDDPVKQAKELMPYGADVVFIANEAYIPASYDYLRQACAIARPLGTVVITRMYGNDIWKAMTGEVSGLTILQPGIYAEETWRGGRARGDYAVTIDALDDRTLNPPGTWTPTIVPIDDLKTTKDVDEMFHSLPAEHSKIFVKIWGE